MANPYILFGIALLVLAVACGLIWFTIVIIRWVLRIDDIIGLLEVIARHTAKDRPAARPGDRKPDS